MRPVAFLLDTVLGILLPAFLLGTGLYLWKHLRFFPIRRPGCVLRSQKGDKEENRGAFRALSVSLAGTLGVGNIAGVAVALSAGGAGAVFWMWVGAFASMIVKYAEIVLTLEFKKKKERAAGGGEVPVCAGAAEYITPTLGKKAGGLFLALCLVCALTMGSLLQGNVIADALQNATGIPPLCCGAALTVLTLFLFCGGRKIVERLSSFFIPLFTLLYVFLSLIFIFANITLLPRVVKRIFAEAFSLRAAGGGAGGLTVILALRAGIGKGLFSNEAGAGTAPLAHGNAAVSRPARQGLYGMAEVLIDTVLVCSMTAFVILLAFDELPAGESGVSLVGTAFSRLYGAAGTWIVLLAIVFFAYATVACWTYYGQTLLLATRVSAVGRALFTLAFSFGLLLGALLPADGLWLLNDVVLACMTFVNLIAVWKNADRLRAITARDGLL